MGMEWTLPDKSDRSEIRVYKMNHIKRPMNFEGELNAVKINNYYSSRKTKKENTN